jgi:hypothetical protein
MTGIERIYQHLLKYCPQKLDLIETYGGVIKRWEPRGKKPRFFFNNAHGIDYFHIDPPGVVAVSNGLWGLSEEQKQTLRALLRALHDDPIEAIAEYGRTTGICAICGAELFTKESLRIGIGPVCRGKIGYTAPARVATDADLF